MEFKRPYGLLAWDCRLGATGRFVILELDKNSAGAVTRLAVDFEQRCEGGPPLAGEVRFNSTIPFSSLANGRTNSHDFNGDSHPDLVWSNAATGATYVWHMDGPVLLADAFVTQIDPSWQIQGIADFNGDGHSDLVWRNTASGATYVWHMDGTSFVSDAFLFSLPPEWQIQGIADLNNDGRPDFLMRSSTSGVGFLWFFNDSTPVGDQFLFSIDPQWKVEAMGPTSFGIPYLLFRNMSTGLAFAWSTIGGNGTPVSLWQSVGPIFTIDPAWEIVQWSDWDADGYADFVFRNRDSGVVFVWYFPSLTLGGSDYITQIDPSWTIVPHP
jgi:hypothetical protein